MIDTNQACRRCGGSGTYSKGTVVNGVCYGCGGSGIRRVTRHAPRKAKGVAQYALVDAQGRHLAINTDAAALEAMMATIQGAVGIEEIRFRQQACCARFAREGYHHVECSEWDGHNG